MIHLPADILYYLFGYLSAFDILNLWKSSFKRYENFWMQEQLWRLLWRQEYSQKIPERVMSKYLALTDNVNQHIAPIKAIWLVEMEAEIALEKLLKIAPNYSYYEAISEAVKLNHFHLLTMFLDIPSRKETNLGDAIMLATRFQRQELVKNLLARLPNDFNRNQHLVSSLYLAIRGCDDQKIIAMINNFL